MPFRCLFLAALLLSTFVHAQSSWSVGRANVPGVSQVYSIAFGNGRFVVTTSGNEPTSPSVIWSTDGESWQPVRPANQFIPQQGTVRFIAGYFYLAASSLVLRSTDGVTWESGPVAHPLVFHRHIATDGRGMLIGSAGLNDTSLLYTADRVTWRRTAPLPEDQLGHVSMGDLAWAAGRYFVSYVVMLPNGNLRSLVAATTDGTAWELVPEIASAFYLVNGNGRLVAYTGGQVSVSTDGRNFTRTAFNPSLANGGRMGFAGGRFFFLGTMQASSDGLTWSPIVPTPPLNAQMLDIAYGNGRYVALGMSAVPSNPPGAIVPGDLIVRLAAGAPPLVSRQPADRTVREGASFALSITVENADPATMFQWRRDGQPIPGATAATLTVERSRLSDAGRYTVEVRNTLGSVVSDPAIVTIVPFADTGRIVNLSVLTSLDTPDATLTTGFVVGGAGTSGTKQLLVRAGGPSLSRFGVDRPNADPKLELFNPGKIAENDQWSGTATLSALSTAVGAFPFLSADSRDAALAATVTAGDNTTRISSNNTTGAVIAEIYDATPASEFTATTPRLVNVSVLKHLATNTTLAAGFVIGGRTSKTVLVRAIGPSLARFGVGSPAPDPSLTLFRTGTVAPLAANDHWSGAADLRTAMTAVGAFELLATSRDAALLLTLEPGDYVAQAAVGASAGAVLLEIYEVPE